MRQTTAAAAGDDPPSRINRIFSEYKPQVVPVAKVAQTLCGPLGHGRLIGGGLAVGRGRDLRGHFQHFGQ